MDSLPPPTLRLLPAGTTSCRVGITPTENPNLAQRTPWRGAAVGTDVKDVGFDEHASGVVTNLRAPPLQDSLQLGP
jgi:hypothetical protein